MKLILDLNGVIALGIAFACIMAAGYIINDLFDVAIDKINKGSKTIIPLHLSLNKAWQLYYIFNGAGVLISILLAFTYHRIGLLWFLPFGIGSLIVYSKWLKKTAFVGNLLIAVLCTVVLWLPVLGEWPLVSEYKNLLIPRLLFTSAIAALTMLMREIIKDQEDIKGDKENNAATLPILWQENKVNLLIAFLSIVTILIIIVSFYQFSISSLPGFTILITMILPLLFLIFSIIFKKSSFTTNSQLLKLIMAAGMIVFPWAMSNFQP